MLIVADVAIGSKQGSTYLDDLRALMPDALVTLVDDIDIESVGFILIRP